MKKQCAKWEKISAGDKYDKGSIFKMHKEFIQTNSKKKNHIKKWVEELNTDIYHQNTVGFVPEHSSKQI